MWDPGVRDGSKRDRFGLNEYRKYLRDWKSRDFRESPELVLFNTTMVSIRNNFYVQKKLFGMMILTTYFKTIEIKGGFVILHIYRHVLKSKGRKLILWKKFEITGNVFRIFEIFGNPKIFKPQNCFWIRPNPEEISRPDPSQYFRYLAHPY